MRDEFSGMIPAAVAKFEALMDALDLLELNPRVTAGYSAHGDASDLRSWGVVVTMTCDDMAELADQAAELGITLQENGSLAYTNGLTLADFQTGRIGADLTINTELEVL